MEEPLLVQVHRVGHMLVMVVVQVVIVLMVQENHILEPVAQQDIPVMAVMVEQL
jgi:hypothetical protein